MNFSYDQWGFDLDLLEAAGNNNVETAPNPDQNEEERAIATVNSVALDVNQYNQLMQRILGIKKSISLYKKKTIDTSTVIGKYKDGCDQITKLENELLTIKNNYREVCIERDVARQSFENLEEDCENLRKRIMELHQKVLDSEQVKVATESHSRQLQQLVKEQDTQIEGMKVEKQLTKETAKSLQKRIYDLRRCKDNLLAQLCTFADIVGTKRALTKTEQVTLTKYLKMKKRRGAGGGVKKNNRGKQNGESDVDVLEDITLSDTEDFTELNDEKIFSPPLLPTKQYANIAKPDSKKDENESDLEMTSEVISVDGGRGSSLELSDCDTVYSPEYYLNSPEGQSSVENCKCKGTKVVNSVTCPIPKTTIDRATSPILVKEDDAVEENKAIRPKTVDKALSPFRYADLMAANIDGIEPLSIISASTSFDLPYRDTSVNDNRSDCEVEMILKTMKLSEGLITPIPPTPSRSLVSKTRSISENARESPQIKKNNDNLEKHNTNNKNIQKVMEKYENDFINTDKCPILLEATSLVPKEHYRSSVMSSMDEQDIIHSPEHITVIEILPNDSTERQDISSINIQNNNIQKVMDKYENDFTNTDKCPILLEGTSSEAKEHNRSSVMSSMDEQDIIHSPEHITVIEILPNDSTEGQDISSMDIKWSEKNNFNENEYQIDIRHNSAKIDDILQQESENAFGCIQKDMKKVSKPKKLTPLQKLKKKLVPKSKIRKNSPPRRMLRSRMDPNSIINNSITSNSQNTTTPNMKKVLAGVKSRQNGICKLRKNMPPLKTLRSRTGSLSITNNSNRVQSESSASLNNKDVYENAVRFMAEMNSKQKPITPEITYKQDQNSGEDILKQKDSKPKILKDKNVNDKTSQKDISEKILNSEEHSVYQHNSITVFANDNTDIINKANDNVKTKNEMNSKKDENNVLRRKSFSPEIDLILSKNRKKYPSLSLDKEIVVVLTRSSLDDISKSLKTSTESNAEVVGNKSPKTAIKSNAEVVDNNKIPETIIESNAEVVDNKSPKTAIKSIAEEVNNKSTKENTTRFDKILKTAQNERKLRSTARRYENSENKICNKKSKDAENKGLPPNPNSSDTPFELVSYNDIDIFNDEPSPKKHKYHANSKNIIQNPENSILCRMIDEHGITRSNFIKKVPDSVAKSLGAKLAEYIGRVVEMPTMESYNVMDEIVQEVQMWSFQEYLEGIINYLMDPIRKLELFNKSFIPSAPSMTKSEQVLLYIVTRASWSNIDAVDLVLKKIAYTLFRLNQTPEMKVVESMAHFYVVVCRYIKDIRRVKHFIYDALYCMQYSAVALIKQCLDVWMHILPLGHMGEAKSPQVICLVYVLHYYKCEDKTNKVQDIRNILKQKYFYNVTDWDETKILETLNNSILELPVMTMDKDMLEMALILIAKRHGPNWCQNKLIKGLLMPIIANKNVPERVKAFCLSLLGDLMKPYPSEMKVHCEIAMNQLIDMLDKNPSPVITEAIFTSLITMSKHNQNRVIKELLSWQPKELSLEMERKFKSYVEEKPVKVWLSILSKLSLVK